MSKVFVDPSIRAAAFFSVMVFATSTLAAGPNLIELPGLAVTGGAPQISAPASAPSVSTAVAERVTLEEGQKRLFALLEKVMPNRAVGAKGTNQCGDPCEFRIDSSRLPQYPWSTRGTKTETDRRPGTLLNVFSDIGRGMGYGHHVSDNCASIASHKLPAAGTQVAGEAFYIKDQIKGSVRILTLGHEMPKTECEQDPELAPAPCEEYGGIRITIDLDVNGQPKRLRSVRVHDRNDTFSPLWVGHTMSGSCRF